MKKALTLLAGLMVTTACRADPDEAWVIRADLPAEVRPLLAVVIDTSAAAGGILRTNEPFDPLLDYGAALPPADRCDADRVYWRRGAGPAPDCLAQAGLELAPTDALSGLQCELARAPLARSGFFVASRAAQWRSDGNYWTAPAPDRNGAVECRADRGRHGASAGALFASDGEDGPWSADAAHEIAWDRAPLADPYILYTGNFLNYLRAPPAQLDAPAVELKLRSLALALAATADLDVALIRNDSDSAASGYVARAPVASAIAAADLEDMAAEAPAGGPALAETLEEASAWLSGDAVRSGTDARADPFARDPSAPEQYRSPFDHACRPVTLAVLAREPTAGAPPPDSDLRADLPGMQGVQLTWPGPGEDAPADPLTFINLVARSFQHDAAVPAAPQLSAPGFLPLDDLERAPGAVFALSAPALRQRWPGNLFRYAFRAPASPLAPPVLVDRDGRPAIDPGSGLPWPDSRSAWSDAPDADLLAGGAAGRLPAPDRRRIHSDAAGDRILDPANRIEPGNPIEVPRTLGDPGLHAPLVIDYPESRQRVAFAATNDGTLHAFDAESGVELWIWIPRELLPRLPALLSEEATTVRAHGIDGALIAHRHDPDGNGRIDAAAGEHLWLLFGLGRGGHLYYALDISDIEDPRRLWSFELPDANVDARAEPVVTRLAVGSSGQSAGDWVVVLAGGYDRRFDAARATGSGNGAALYVVDAVTGRRLWSAGAGDDHDLTLPGLSSVAAAPRALDLDGDRRLDRAYLLDVAGQMWRIEFQNGGNAPELAQSSMIARLGTGSHRFYATPDASVVRTSAGDRLAIAAGSGWHVRPRDATAVDRVYLLFDDGGPAASPLTESDLHDATGGTSVPPPAARGWFARLDRHGAGEKVSGPTVTFDHALHFQTYQPLPANPLEPCGPPRASVRRYALDVRSGLRHATAAESGEDDAEEVAASGLPVDLRFAFPGRWEDPCPGCRPRPFGMAGTQAFDTGYAGDPVKTSWRKLRNP